MIAIKFLLINEKSWHVVEGYHILWVNDYECVFMNESRSSVDNGKISKVINRLMQQMCYTYGIHFTEYTFKAYFSLQ